MPRLIFKCPYLPPGAGGDRGGYAVYIAIRDGVEVIPAERRELPATSKQRTLIEKLLQDFPDAADSFEYDDFVSSPTVVNASEFIIRTLENNFPQAKGREGYVEYISERPRVARVGEHGLFGSGDGPLVLSRVAEEIRSYPGNVWAPIFSLRREDADRLGYDNAANWQALLQSHTDTLSRWLKILPDDLVWYAAFHDEGHHPHIHMLCYSRDPKQGFLTKEGIRSIKSEFVRDIFRCDLEAIYQRQTLHRTETVTASREVLQKIVEGMVGGVLDNEAITQKMTELTDRLRFHSGKMVYGYLRPPLKATVDSVVDELGKDARVATAYSKWCEDRQAVIKSYKDTPEPAVPLSRNKEFKQVRNLVVREAALLMRGGFSVEETVKLDELESLQVDEADVVPLAEAPISTPDILPVSGGAPYVQWTDRYKWALTFLYGTKTDPPSFDDAWELFFHEAKAGNALAMHDLGRMLEKGLGREIDLDGAHDWYAKALSAFHAVEETEPGKYVEYRIGKMYNAGLGTQQDHAEAAEWFERSASQQYKYAQYSLGCLYRDGKGVEKDAQSAFDLFSQSAEQYFPYASFECGKMLRDGIGTEKDDTDAERHFREAFFGFQRLEAERPDDLLQYRLGWMLLKGTGTEKDICETERYFRLAARQNNVRAQYQLAKLIFTEAGPSDERMTEALGWMQKAAEAGLDFAQYALGKFYLFGNAEYRDEQAAVYWLTLSANQGNIYATFLLERREQWQRGAVLLSGSRLLSGIGRIFSSKLPSPQEADRARFVLDRKRRRELWQKKDGRGIGDIEMSSF